MCDTWGKMLAVIPARGGSKGLPGKNICLLADKPLICYTIDAARGILPDKDICVSSDSKEITGIVEGYGLKVPFLRPSALATDTSKTTEVLLHALDFYECKGEHYETLLLLQPTSPFRTVEHIRKALELYDRTTDMVVSVKSSHSASVICSENAAGYLELTLNKGADRRQNLNYYEYNGAIYIINIASFRREGKLTFKKIKKYVMDDLSSMDIYNWLDYEFAELLMRKKYKISDEG